MNNLELRLVHFFLLILIRSTGMYAQWSDTPAVKTPICTVASTQSNPKIISDDSIGTIIVRNAARNESNFNIYAEPIKSNGLSPWTNNGVLVSSSTNNQNVSQIISDGYKRAILTWEAGSGSNFVIYSQRINASELSQWAIVGVEIIYTHNKLMQVIYCNGQVMERWFL